MSPFDLTRRDFLSSALLVPALTRQTSDARFLGTISLGDPGGATAPPFGRLLGDGLDARLFTDLSTLGQQSAIESTIESAIRNPQSAMLTAADQFFVRTAAPRLLPPPAAWSLRLGGLARAPLALSADDLAASTVSAGRVLLECSGNADQTNYGLMSAADWDGVPLLPLLDRARPPAGSYRVLVSGVDDMAATPRTSVPGASWIFSRNDLERALLATRMNGAALPPDHGAPVRLIVPGWYGCSCIKWVDRIELVSEKAAATTQMREFAARTHQPFNAAAASPSSRDRSLLSPGYPLLARDFIPAVIDTAAMPVRVEKWLVGGRVAYRITGIIWGGTTPTAALSIRFKASGPWVRVDDCPLPKSTLTWSLWSHTWRPDAPGRYQIVLRVEDPAIRTRRLDLFFYVREIVIDEI